MRIAVLGAGISGLATAYSLQKRGHDVVVFEARDRAGGNAFTEERDGCVIEWGVGSILDNEPRTLALIEELGLAGEVVRANDQAAVRYVWRAGRLRQLPTSPKSFLFGDILPLRARLRVLLEPRFAKRALEADDPSVRDFFLHRFGADAADVLADAFVTGVWAGDPARLSFRCAFPKLAALEGSLLKGARGAGPPGKLISFRRGMSTIIEALVQRVNVRLGDGWETLEQRDFDRVVCTLPPARVPATGALRDALDRVPAAPVAVVAMAFRRDEVIAPDGFGLLAPYGQGLRILGTLYDSSIFAGRAPDGIALFRTMVGGRRDPGAVDLDDSALQELVLADLKRAWGSVPTPRVVAIHRWRLGITQYEIGHAALLQTVASLCPPWLRLAGSGYRGISFNACVAEGVDWAP